MRLLEIFSFFFFRKTIGSHLAGPGEDQLAGEAALGLCGETGNLRVNAGSGLVELQRADTLPAGGSEDRMVPRLRTSARAPEPPVCGPGGGAASADSQERIRLHLAVLNQIRGEGLGLSDLRVIPTAEPTGEGPGSQDSGFCPLDFQRTLGCLGNPRRLGDFSAEGWSGKGLDPKDEAFLRPPGWGALRCPCCAACGLEWPGAKDRGPV